MTPETIVLILSYAIKYGPEAVRIVRRMLAAPAAVTDADWDALEAILMKPGASYFVPVGSTQTRSVP